MEVKIQLKKSVRATQWGKGQIFQLNGTGTIICIHGKRLIQLDPSLTTYTKTNSKGMIDLNIKAKAIKLFEEI